MRIWITGPQGTLKRDISQRLSADGWNLCKLFTTSDIDDKFYHHDLYNKFTKKDVSSVFEAESFMFIKDDTSTPNKFGTLEGVTLNDYEDSNLFVLTVDQFVNVDPSYISKDDLVVFVDGTRSWRYKNIKNIYGDDFPFDGREKVEESVYVHFYNCLKAVKTKNVLYFNNEDPQRVKTIIKIFDTLPPKLKNELIKNFSE